MRHAPASLCGAAVLWLLTLGGGSARADLIQWSYDWSSSPNVVHADSPGTSTIKLTDGGLQNATGNSDIIATNIRTHSTADPAKPDTFTAKPYTLSLYLLDPASGKSGTLVFTGQFNGTLSSQSANITTTFTNAVTQTLDLGNHRYTVTVSSYTPPGPPGSSSGSIGAHADVAVETIIKDVPEPSTFVLASLAVPLLSFAGWRRRARRVRSPS